jgi:hypothetical protein
MMEEESVSREDRVMQTVIVWILATLLYWWGIL